MGADTVQLDQEKRMRRQTIADAAHELLASGRAVTTEEFGEHIAARRRTVSPRSTG